MTRQAVAVALLAFLTAAPLVARPGASKAVYTCGTDPKRPKRTEGRLDTWSLSSLGFTPDIRTLKPLRILYKSITRIEFGPGPGPRAEHLLEHPCSVDRQDHYLTIFYKEVLPDGEEQADNPDEQDPRDARNAREKAFGKKYSTDPHESNDSKEQRDAKDEKRARDEKPLRQSENSKARQQEKEKDKERIAVFVLGEGELRPTLRILETRSGKRVGYRDVASRKAAR